MHFTPATSADIDFVAEAIIAAVKSGTDTLSYSTLFGIPESEFIPLLKGMLEEDVEGQELSLNGFLIAKDTHRQNAATCCAWVEGEEGPSALLTAQVLGFFIGAEKLQQNNHLIEALRIDREEGALQIEHVYTAPNHRGHGLAAKVIQEQVKQHAKRLSQLKKVQIILFKQNENALKAYTKMGFTVAQEKHTDNPEILHYFPASTRVLMEATVEKIVVA